MGIRHPLTALLWIVPVLALTASCIGEPPADPAVHALVNTQSVRCLVANPGGVVSPQPCRGPGERQWVIRLPLIVNTRNGHCLDLNQDGAVVLTPCAGRARQRWVIGRGPTIRNITSGLCLTHKVTMGTCDGTGSQQWEITTRDQGMSAEDGGSKIQGK